MKLGLVDWMENEGLRTLGSESLTLAPLQHSLVKSDWWCLEVGHIRLVSVSSIQRGARSVVCMQVC